MPAPSGIRTGASTAGANAPITIPPAVPPAPLMNSQPHARGPRFSWIQAYVLATVKPPPAAIPPAVPARPKFVPSHWPRNQLPNRPNIPGPSGATDSGGYVHEPGLESQPKFVDERP